jgi:hypothetical protein
MNLSTAIVPSGQWDALSTTMTSAPEMKTVMEIIANAIKSFSMRKSFLLAERIIFVYLDQRSAQRQIFGDRLNLFYQDKTAGKEHADFAVYHALHLQTFCSGAALGIGYSEIGDQNRLVQDFIDSLFRAGHGHPVACHIAESLAFVRFYMFQILKIHLIDRPDFRESDSLLAQATPAFCIFPNTELFRIQDGWLALPLTMA